MNDNQKQATSQEPKTADTPILPREPEIERILLGAPLLREDPEQVKRIRKELHGSAFTVQAHREIFDEMCAMLDRGDPINATILQVRLRARGANAGPVDIARLVDGVPLYSDLSAEIQILKDATVRREIIRCADAWLTEAQARDANVPNLARAIADRAAEFGCNTVAQAAPISVRWGELCELKLERRETILHEVERGEIVMCPAITNRGKTTYWRNGGLSLACGREFAPIVGAGQPRPVLYLDFETRIYRARADINKMLGSLSQEQRALVSQNFHLIADCRIQERPLTLSSPRHLEIVEAEARRVKADVIILDTLTAAFEIEDENNNAEAARVMKKLTGLAQRLACVIVFLHHIGKPKQENGGTVQAVHRARGASAYSGFSHAIFSMVPDPVMRERNTLECSKVKGERFEDTIINLNLQTRWFESAGVAVKQPSQYEQMIGIFNGQPMKRAEILKALPAIPRGTVDRLLEDAVKSEDLIKLDRGTYRKPDNFSISHDYRDEKLRSCSEIPQGIEDSLDFEDWDENHSEKNEDGDFDPLLEAIDR